MKTPEEVLKQTYVTALDLKTVIPSLSYFKALKYIEEMQEEMKKRNYYVPEGNLKVALTKIFIEKFGL